MLKPNNIITKKSHEECHVAAELFEIGNKKSHKECHVAAELFEIGNEWSYFIASVFATCKHRTGLNRCEHF